MVVPMHYAKLLTIYTFVYVFQLGCVLHLYVHSENLIYEMGPRLRALHVGIFKFYEAVTCIFSHTILNRSRF